MGLSAWSVRRPVATTMVFASLMVLGVLAFFRLKIDLLPELDFPSISVVVEYPGVGPEEMETLITRRVEEAVARVEGIDRIESFSSEGRSRVALRFDWGVPLEAALNDVRASVERVRALMPEEAEPPVIYKFDLANFPIMNLALESDMDEGALRRFADDVVKPRLERVPGLASVDVRGARDREIRIEVEPDALEALGLSPLDVVNALRRENLTVPAGPVEFGDQNILVRPMSEFTSLDEVRNALIVRRNGHPVRVRDVAEVRDDFEEFVNIVRIDGERGVEITVTKSPDANTVEVAEAMRVAIAEFNEDYEGRASVSVIVDTSVFIQRSIEEVQSSVLVGALLSVLVLLVFLRSIRATLVVATAIPISVIGTFFLMEQLDLTLNLISFGGLALGLGMLVDNAIVILENVYRRRQMGDDPITAAIEGAGEVSGAVFASTLTTVAVFVPVIFLTGFAGVFFSQMSLVVSASLLCSLVVAMTLVPMLAARLLRTGNAVQQADARWLQAIDNAYGRVTGFVLRHRFLTMVVAIGVLAGSVTQADTIGSELLPQSDESEVRINLEYPVGTRIEVTTEAVQRAEDVIRREVPEVFNVLSTIGTPGFFSTDGEESAQLRVNLVSPDQRTRSSGQVAAELLPILQRELPGMRVRARPGTGLWIFNFIRGGDSRIRVDVRGYDLEVSERLTQQVVAAMSEVEGILDVRPSRRPGGRELQLSIDRERAADYGLSTSDVADTISTLVQGRNAGVYREGGDEFNVRVRLSDENLRSIDHVLASPMRLPDGRSVQLRDLVASNDGRTPLAIERLDQERIVTISANNAPGRDVGSINTELAQRFAAIEVPDGFSILVAGEAQEQSGAFGALGLGFLLALALVYMVMAAQFESFLQPLVIMMSIPFAAVGVIWTLVLTETTFNLNSFMGCVVLVGVVVNNAIVLVDYSNMLRHRDGMELRAAVIEASRRRLRPILMTTLTTVLALLPVAMATGAGSETQTPLARVVVGGMVVSTLVTLIVIPVLYHAVEGAIERFTAWRTRRQTVDIPAEMHEAAAAPGE
jgi:HAE1 family hydrophobic/amphiphilic exporter-1